MIASEVFSADIASFNDAFFAGESLLIEHLFRFLNKEEELNSVLCGYFCKLVG